MPAEPSGLLPSSVVVGVSKLVDDVRVERRERRRAPHETHRRTHRVQRALAGVVGIRGGDEAVAHAEAHGVAAHAGATTSSVGRERDLAAHERSDARHELALVLARARRVPSRPPAHDGVDAVLVFLAIVVAATARRRRRRGARSRRRDDVAVRSRARDAPPLARFTSTIAKRERVRERARARRTRWRRASASRRACVRHVSERSPCRTVLPAPFRTEADRPGADPHRTARASARRDSRRV